MLRECSFDTGEVVLNYGEGPQNGPSLVLLHGGTDKRSTFDSVIPALIEDWHVYALDFRGHGKSGRAATGYTIPDYARDVVEFVRKKVGSPVVFMGHSMGADTSLFIAADAPDVVRAAVLEEPLYSDKNLRIPELSVYDALLSFQRAIAASPTMEGISAELARERPCPTSLRSSRIGTFMRWTFAGMGSRAGPPRAIQFLTMPEMWWSLSARRLARR